MILMTVNDLRDFRLKREFDYFETINDERNDLLSFRVLQRTRILERCLKPTRVKTYPGC